MRPAEVGDDGDERPLAGDGAEHRERRREVGRGAPALLAEREQHPDEAGATLPGRQRLLGAGADRDEPDAVAARARSVTERERDPESHVRLAPVGGPESHRRRAVEHDPRHEHPLGELDANVGLARARRHVPVDQPDVVARLVRANLRQLAAAAEQVRAMIAREHAVDTPSDRELEGAEQRLRHRPRAGALRRLDDTECPRAGRHAATGRPSSSGGAATVASTASSTSSAERCSASARYVSTRRWRSASFASERTSVPST